MDKPRQRPVHLNLLVIRLPVTGVVSILHRVTGVLLVLAFPVFLYLLHLSLRDADGFAEARAFLGSTPGRLLSWLALGLTAQHFFSGLRHLLLDVDVGIGKPAARLGAWLVFVASAATVGLAWVLA
jgi:succinate dehydrogenase / fumarate reductase cytochrome b subunit